MRNLTEIEINGILLLSELELEISKGNTVSPSVVIQMNELRKAIDDEDKRLGKDLEDLYRRYKNTNKI